MGRHKKVVELHKCKYCGKTVHRKKNEFPGAYAKREFCNTKCRRAYRLQQLPTKKCPVCGTTMYAENGLSALEAKVYCSKTCRAAATKLASACTIEGCGGKVAGRGLCWKHYRRWKRHGDPLYKSPAKVYAKHPCLQCGGDIIESPPSKANQKFCNTKCYANYRREHSQAAPKLFCEFCGKPITRKRFPSGRWCQMVVFKEKRFCDRICSGAARKGKPGKVKV